MNPSPASLDPSEVLVVIYHIRLRDSPEDRDNGRLLFILFRHLIADTCTRVICVGPVYINICSYNHYV
jgi:hypothetical protein